MKLFRYRKPSVKTVLGITRVKKQLKKDLGITGALSPFRAPGNAIRRVKRRTGYSTAKRVVKGQLPTPFGCLFPLLAGLLGIALVLVVRTRL